MRIDVLIENKLPDGVDIYVVDDAEGGGEREFVGHLVSGGRRYFALDYEFDDGRLEAFSIAENGLTDTSRVYDGLHWHVK